MSGHNLIDWTAPWLEPWRDPGEVLAGAVRAGECPLAVLNRLARAPVQFVAQAELPKAMAYEQFISAYGRVPTRENLHDFFNALCWMQFPRSKRRLNRLQATEIASTGVRAVRGPVRDACTLFDENAALLQAPDELWDALAARQWSRLFGELRPLWRHAGLVVFGHAALEKLVAPYKSITAHVWRVTEPWASLHELDAWLDADLTPAKLAAKPFVPLPVLGVPGWWPANEDPGFYADAAVFRPARRAQPAAQ